MIDQLVIFNILRLFALASALSLPTADVATPGHDVISDVLPARIEYTINADKSKFMVYAERTGLLFFKGKSHRIAVRDFDGKAGLSFDAASPASLELNIRAASLGETSDQFTADQKKIIDKELKDEVLETGKFPTIAFRSTNVKGMIQNGQFNVVITGDISLHGVTKTIKIPAAVTADGDTLRATGKFKLNRKDFGVNATKAFHGTIRIRHTLSFEFDIVATRT